LKFRIFSDFADHLQGDVQMIEPINHTGNIACPGNYKPQPSILAKGNGYTNRKDMSQTASKYILEDNKILFERYDRNGKLILRVPCTAHKVSEKA